MDHHLNLSLSSHRQFQSQKSLFCVGSNIIHYGPGLYLLSLCGCEIVSAYKVLCTFVCIAPVNKLLRRIVSKYQRVLWVDIIRLAVNVNTSPASSLSSVIDFLCKPRYIKMTQMYLNHSIEAVLRSTHGNTTKYPSFYPEPQTTPTTSFIGKSHNKSDTIIKS